jgi:HD-like signal output (HDOD) protein
MSEKHPFQLRDHGHQIIEIIVHDLDINPDHKAIATLQLLNKKFDQIILCLEETASLNPELLPVLLKVGEFGALKIVAPEAEQIPFDLHGILVFKDVFSAIRRIAGERNAEKILKQISRIGLTRTTAYNLLQMMRNPEVKFEEIEEVTSKDPNLVMRMLKTANTAYFSRRVPVETLKAAVTYLGLEGIRQLLVHELFSSFTQFFSNQRDRLAHMRRCSHLSAYIGKLIKADLPTIGKMRVAGLLHDLGSLAFAFYDSQEYSKVLSLIRRERVSTYDAEMRIFGVSHQYLGALYAREMGMPDYIVSAIEKHHDAEINKDDLVLMSVVCANGFLNEKIEQINHTGYDHLLELLAAEIDDKNPELQKLKKLTEKQSESDFNPVSTEDADDSAGEDGEDDSEAETPEKAAGESDLHAEITAKSFKPMQFYGLLKEELDQFILSGAGAQGD